MNLLTAFFQMHFKYGSLIISNPYTQMAAALAPRFPFWPGPGAAATEGAVSAQRICGSEWRKEGQLKKQCRGSRPQEQSLCRHTVAVSCPLVHNQTSLFYLCSSSAIGQSNKCGLAGVFFFFKLINYSIYFWLRWVFCCARAFSSCSERGLLFVAWASHCGGFSLPRMGSRHAGFSSCGTWAQ